MRDWDHLRIILTVARTGGLSAAARELGVNHATVSRQLDRAETETGTQFFVRLPNGLELTEAGRAAVAHAERIEGEIIGLEIGLAGRPVEAGELTVTIPPLLVNSDVAEDLRIFRERFPKVELTIHGDYRLADLHRHEADVALRISDAPAESLWGRKVADQNGGWYASKDLLARLGNSLSDGSASVPFIQFTSYEKDPDDLKARFPNSTLALKTDDMATALTLARHGHGALRLPGFFSSDEPDLVRIPEVDLFRLPPVWALTHPSLQRNPLVVGFIRFIADRFAKRAEKFLGTAS